MSDVLHGVRKFGNLGAHQKRLACTGEIVDIEAGEAEWMLGALEAVFDHYYVKPAETKKVLEGLERKRRAEGPRRGWECPIVPVPPARSSTPLGCPAGP